MTHEFDVQLDLARLNRNSRYAWVRRVWRVVVVMIVLVFLVMLLQFGWRWGLPAGAFGSIIVVGVVFALMHRRISRTNARLIALSGGSLHFTVCEEWLHVSHDAARAQVRWHALGPIIKLKSDWLMMMNEGRSYYPLPLDQVPDDALLFIESEVTAHRDQLPSA